VHFWPTAKKVKFFRRFLTVLGGDSDGSSNWIKHFFVVEYMRNNP
jgi:hypothetical protein